MGQIQAVIFDLDGVLVDTEIWWDEVRREFAARQARPWTTDDRAAVMGANSRQWSTTMAERLHVAIPRQEIERAIVDGMIERYRSAAERDGRVADPVIPGAVGAVRRLIGRYALAVASSAHREVIDAALAATGLADAFPVVVSSDEVSHGKPSPDVYLFAADGLGIYPAHCLVIEDSLNGVLAGRAAGMLVVLVPNASVPPAPGAREAATIVLDRIGDLDPEGLPL